MELNPRLAPVLAILTPERLAALIRDLAARQPAGSRGDVSVPHLTAELLRGIDLGSPAEAWAAQLTLQRALAETVALIPDMEYVEGDS
jgi:hypothetical protein